MIANAGAGTDLFVLAPFTNNGTLLANNGVLVVEGSGFSNVSGTTLTGGSYIVQGPTAGTFNQIEFGVNFTAMSMPRTSSWMARRRTSRSSTVAPSSRSRHSFRPSPAPARCNCSAGVATARPTHSPTMGCLYCRAARSTRVG